MDTKWRCFFSAYAYKYVQTPIFYINAAYDYWQLAFILEMYCHPKECPEQLSHLTIFHYKFMELVKAIQQSSDKNGMFIVSCFNHILAFDDETFKSLRVSSTSPKTLQVAIGDWYFNRVSEGSSFYIDCDDSCDCNPACDWSLNWYNRKKKRGKISCEY